MTRPRRALIVGLGISGLAAALRLHQIGWQVEIIERAPARRTGGYFIGLFGAGRHAAQRLGLLDLLHDRSPEAPIPTSTAAAANAPD
jgi:2-polyprenyl-6-methoxyphenol hydroxylase and related FAD-dependent oxidoreductases